MKIFKKFTDEAARMLNKNGIGVIPTDTIYGIVCSAFSKKAVEQVYRLRKRSPHKPVIVLIASMLDLKKFGIAPDNKSKKMLGTIWPAKASVVLPCYLRKFSYLHRGKKTIAFRLSAKKELQKFLKKTGPLIAPSANFEGRQPARTIKEAQKYFGEKADFYVDAGKLKSKPSTLVSLKNGKFRVVRPGAVKIDVPIG